MNVTFAYLSAITMLLELMKYFLAYRYVLCMSFKRPPFVILGFLGGCTLLQFIASILVPSDESSVVIIMCTILFTIWFVDASDSDKVKSFFLIMATVSIIDMSGSIIINYQYNGYSTLLDGNQFVDLLNNLPSLGLILGIFIYRRCTTVPELSDKLSLSKVQYIIVTSGIFSGFLLLVYLQYFVTHGIVLEDGRIIMYAAVACIACMYIVLCIYQAITLSRAQRYHEKMKYYEEYLSVQEKYTQNIIDNDKRIRRFKHDFYAHFIVMKELCKNAQYEELNKYMGVMEQASGFNDTPRYTNNTAVDAIIYDRIQQAKKNEIEIKIEGSVTSECPVNNYDLCTIISNLLRNAIEACMLVDVSERTIQMEIYPYENKFYLCVKNKVHEFVEITNDTVNTTKSNKLDHGFGIQNVKQVVERYEGYFGMSCEEGHFEVQILI